MAVSTSTSMPSFAIYIQLWTSIHLRLIYENNINCACRSHSHTHIMSPYLALSLIKVMIGKGRKSSAPPFAGALPLDGAGALIALSMSIQSHVSGKLRRTAADADGRRLSSSPPPLPRPDVGAGGGGGGGSMPATTDDSNRT